MLITTEVYNIWYDMVRFMKGHHFNQDKLKFIEFVKKQNKKQCSKNKQIKNQNVFLSGIFHISSI